MPWFVRIVWGASVAVTVVVFSMILYSCAASHGQYDDECIAEYEPDGTC